MYQQKKKAQLWECFEREFKGSNLQVSLPVYDDNNIMTVKTLSSHLVTLERRRFFTDAVRPSQAPILPSRADRVSARPTSD
eukprot:7763313-Pyramimonas_sp.AAC.1